MAIINSMFRSVQEVPKYTTKHIRGDIIITRKLRYLATVQSWRGWIFQLLLYIPQFRNHSCLLESQQIPELHWSQFQSLPCTPLPTLSLAGQRLSPGQFSELQLPAMQSQTLPQLNQQCLLGQAMVAGPAQAIEPGNPGICTVNRYCHDIDNTHFQTDNKRQLT